MKVIDFSEQLPGYTIKTYKNLAFDSIQQRMSYNVDVYILSGNAVFFANFVSFDLLANVTKTDSIVNRYQYLFLLQQQEIRQFLADNGIPVKEQETFAKTFTEDELHAYEVILGYRKQIQSLNDKIFSLEGRPMSS